MKALKAWHYLVPTAAFMAACLWHTTPVRSASRPVAQAHNSSWSRQAAADYLDQRQTWWQGWATAQRDHGTVCVSCHTGLPYMLARPALRGDLHEAAVSLPERQLIGNIEKRVNAWSEMVPFYSDADYGAGKTAQSHATEAVVNAIILTNYDQRAGQLRPVTRAALDAAWALQYQTGQEAGGWLWQNFHLAPWESGESSYQGAALLMLAVGGAPSSYVSDERVRGHITLLTMYLRGHYAAQPLANKICVLWASARAPGLLTKPERQALVKEISALQQADGGWSLPSLDKQERADKTAQSSDSDGYATALVLLATQADAADPSFAWRARGYTWLEQHQEKDGRWLTASLNKQRDPESNIGRFMSDAATGYAVSALESKAPAPEPPR